MSKEIFVKLMNVLGKIYDKEIDKETLEIWLSYFSENTTNEFKEAVNQHIKTSSKFPTIADIKKLIYDNSSESYDNTELWEKLLKAIRNSNYHAEEEFEELPEIVKAYIRSPYQLQEMAIMNSDDLHNIEKGRFFKQIEILKQSYEKKTISGKTNNLLMNKGIYMLENDDE